MTYTVSIFMFCRSPRIVGSNYSNGVVRQMIRLSNYQTIVPKGYALKSVSITKKVTRIATRIELPLSRRFLR